LLEERRVLFGIPFEVARLSDALRLCSERVESGVPLTIGVCNAAKIVKMRHDFLLSDSVLSSDVIYADGMSIVWASRLLRRPLPERVAGIDLFYHLTVQAAELGRSVYFLGATDEVLDSMLERLQAELPGLRVAGRRNGYFTPEDEDEVAREIAASGASYLFLGITSPKKEKFLARWGRQLGVSICHGVGGSFDIYAGKTQRAPESWQRLGLEWLYRVVQEPRRMWKRYLVTNTIFLGLLAREFFRPCPLLPRPAHPDEAAG
jgi:N-acetylglucosaminyldiphosphoundecaprenol N-acetyl-beta-D-mannosaminyltransferase